MAKKKIEEQEKIVPENIVDEPLESVMSDRFASYAKYVIQDRAIPDVRDGLKPVQRRIIFAMYKDGNTINKPTRKCAHTVGAVMGKYHPHGDSSIYEALARMSQDWKIRAPLIDFQGNNGSIDGDPPAAYRYTEARLSEIANELVRDIDKDTIDMQLTFDDSEFEPVVLPSRFPNLLANGSEGIAVAIATEIPPHNLNELIDAIVWRINHVNVTTEDLMKFVKGPDFPTGGIIYQSEGLKSIYETGRGRIEVAAKTEIQEVKGTPMIVITEFPYKTIKINTVFEIDKIRHSKAIDGIVEVRDESDIEGVRVVVELKKNADPNLILNYLMRKTSLLTNYSANMIAIADGRPKTITLVDYVDDYIKHQEDVVTRRSRYDLEKYRSRLHIVNGLILAIINIDKVVHIIKASKDKADSKTNLMKEFDITIDQAEAIVMLPLYKLNNTDVSVLESEKKELEKSITELVEILGDKNKLNRVIIKELKDIGHKYGTPRRTIIQEKAELAPIDSRDLIMKEDVMIAVTSDGYIKRSSLKSYASSGKDALPGIKDGDTLVASGQATTRDSLICFTNFGNYILLSVNDIKDGKWKEEGKHLNYLTNIDFLEKIIRVYNISNFRNDIFFILASKYGQIKRSPISSFEVSKCNKALTAMRLLSGDEIVDIRIASGNSDIVLFTGNGGVTYFNENDISPTGPKSGGVKSISSLKSTYVAGFLTFTQDEKKKMLLVTESGCARVFDLNYINKTKRLGKVQVAFRTFKSEPHQLIYVDYIDKNIESYRLNYINSKGTLIETVIDDFHLTPIDKYAKKNINLPSNTTITSIFKEGLLCIDDKIVSYFDAPITEEKEEETPNSISVFDGNEISNPSDEISEEDEANQVHDENNIPSKKDEDKKKDDNYEQISIFDDLDNEKN